MYHHARCPQGCDSLIEDRRRFQAAAAAGGLEHHGAIPNGTIIELHNVPLAAMFADDLRHATTLTRERWELIMHSGKGSRPCVLIDKAARRPVVFPMYTFGGDDAERMPLLLRRRLLPVGCDGDPTLLNSGMHVHTFDREWVAPGDSRQWLLVMECVLDEGHPLKRFRTHCMPDGGRFGMATIEKMLGLREATQRASEVDLASGPEEANKLLAYFLERTCGSDSHFMGREARNERMNGPLTPRKKPASPFQRTPTYQTPRRLRPYPAPLWDSPSKDRRNANARGRQGSFDHAQLEDRLAAADRFEVERMNTPATPCKQPASRSRQLLHESPNDRASSRARPYPVPSSLSPVKNRAYDTPSLEKRLAEERMLALRNKLKSRKAASC
ncbi:hypothetical protein HMN09_00940900 [Mycena chlorophos]|uniref:Uncharacterized protein n=1 Tax=Mycena chlorophos TaxID=658473 RepID=A0A8H6SIZ1_MYCCL|nr:hypothetical protein HMN09_00940900 [Mycena chlorophos]